MNQSTYMQAWGVYIGGLSLITLLFMNEKNDQTTDDEDVSSFVEVV